MAAMEKLGVKAIAKKITELGIRVVRTDTGRSYLIYRGMSGTGRVMKDLKSETAVASVYRQLIDGGLSVTTSEVGEAITYLRVEDTAPVPLFRRVAACGECLYLDLGDQNRSVVEIRPGSWSITTDYELLFHRPQGMLPLPEPTRGGTVDRLREILGLSGDLWWLFLGAILAAYNQRGPHFLTVVEGPSGAGKSVLARCIARLVDPREPQLNRLRTEFEATMVSGHNRWLLGFDNLNPPSRAQSADLSAMVTGTGLESRRLYTDAESSSISVCAPVVINGIEGLLAREEIRTRAVPLLLAKRRSFKREDEINAAIQNELPAILGAILDCLAAGLASPTAGQEWGTRTCTAESWVESCFSGSGFGEGVFTAALDRARQQVAGQVIRSWPLFDVVQALAEENAPMMTATEIWQMLKESCNGGPLPADWPINATSLGKQLSSRMSELAAVGIVVESDRMRRGTQYQFRLGTPATAA